MNDPPNHRACAFTLVELLTVVAIVALLIAVVVPALAGAREQAKAVVCSAHLRECFQALHMYTTDNRGWLPYMGSYYAIRKFAHPDREREWPTAIAPYLHDAWDVHRCPSDADPVAVRVRDGELERIDGPPAPEDAAGVRRAYLSYRGEERRRARLTAPRRPHDAILLIEGMTHTGRSRPLDHFHTLVRPGSAAVPVHPSFFRHRGASNFLFYSGAVERISGDALDRLQIRHLNADLPSVYAAPR